VRRILRLHHRRRGYRRACPPAQAGCRPDGLDHDHPARHRRRGGRRHAGGRWPAELDRCDRRCDRAAVCVRTHAYAKGRRPARL
ncbi:MAG: hypothetical protein AVDCRST_MAG71-1043, partial [uncultured Lysobacter sp.]